MFYGLDLSVCAFLSITQDSYGNTTGAVHVLFTREFISIVQRPPQTGGSLYRYIIQKVLGNCCNVSLLLCYWFKFILRGSGEVGGVDGMLNALPLHILDRDGVLYVFNSVAVS